MQRLQGVVGEGQPFAEVSYKRFTHQVLRWPCHSFPFELGSSGKLEIQDELAFQQQYRKPAGSCFLNLETLPAVQGLQELRLPLEASPSRSRLWPALPPTAMPRGVVVTTLRVLLQRREKLAAVVWALSVGETDFTKVFEPHSDSEADLLANRWRAKYEKQKGVVEGLQREHEAALQKLSRKGWRDGGMKDMKMDDRVQLYKVQVAATMELCGKIVWQRMAHVALRAWAGWVADEKTLCCNGCFDARKGLRGLEEVLVPPATGGADGALDAGRGTDLLQQIVLAAWHGTLGSHALQLAAQRLERLDDAAARRQLRRDSAQLVAKPAPRLWQVELALQMWILVVRSKQNNSLVANMVDFTSKRIYMAAGLLSLCFCRWHASISRFDLRVQSAREAQLEALRRQRQLTTKVMGAVPCRVLPTCMAKFAFCCWQDVTQQTKVQQRLELQHSQRESAETQLTTDRKEMQRLQVAAGQEESGWQTEHAELLERLQHLQSRQSEAESKLQKARDRRLAVAARIVGRGTCGRETAASKTSLDSGDDCDGAQRVAAPNLPVKLFLLELHCRSSDGSVAEESLKSPAVTSNRNGLRQSGTSPSVGDFSVTVIC
eukprot:s1547_g8.t1